MGAAPAKKSSGDTPGGPTWRGIVVGQRLASARVTGRGGLVAVVLAAVAAGRLVGLAGRSASRAARLAVASSRPARPMAIRDGVWCGIAALLRRARVGGSLGRHPQHHQGGCPSALKQLIAPASTER
jgi:hypothetical protein